MAPEHATEYRGERTTADETTADEGRPSRLLYPEFGAVESLIGFGVFYFLVDALTPTLVSSLAGPLPDLVPEPLTTVSALLLWLVFGVTVLAIALTQWQANPRQFPGPSQRAAFLETHRPSEAEYRFNLVLMVLGGATAVLAWDSAVAVLQGMIPLVVEVGEVIPPVLTLGNVAIFVVFFVGVAAYARGLDRLVIGGMREFLYRSLLDEWD